MNTTHVSLVDYSTVAPLLIVTNMQVIQLGSSSCRDITILNIIAATLLSFCVILFCCVYINNFLRSIIKLSMVLYSRKVWRIYLQSILATTDFNHIRTTQFAMLWWVLIWQLPAKSPNHQIKHFTKLSRYTVCSSCINTILQDIIILCTCSQSGCFIGLVFVALKVI